MTVHPAKPARPDDKQSIVSHAGFTIVATAAIICAITGAIILFGRTAFGFNLNFSAGASATTFSAYITAAALVLWRGATVARQFGVANRITWARVTITAILAGCVFDVAQFNETAWWIITFSACFALILDGMDGFFARRLKESSKFGARFDMETDAALILVLTALVWQSGKMGPWVLIIGAMRYVFVAAGWLFPRLTAPLPPSLRRKLVCALQVFGLLLCVAPIVTPNLAVIIAAVALTALTLSFARDVISLCLVETRRVKQEAGDI
jgi:phosphatidylglycerophosphate synthase